MGVNIDYNSILEIALKGIRRAYVFLGFGYNAAEDPNVKNYSLTDVSIIQIGLGQVDDIAMSEFKRSFLIWITGNGLREIIESFNNYLDKIFDASLAIAVSKGVYTVSKAKSMYQRFERYGLKKKLNILKQEFEISAKNPDELQSINLARNALTHNRGIVTSNHCNEESHLVIRWNGVDILFPDKHGKDIIITSPIKEPIESAGGTLRIRKAKRELRFPVGKVIKIPPKDLAERGFFFIVEAKEIFNSSLDYPKRMGIPVKGSKQVPGFGEIELETADEP